MAAAAAVLRTRSSALLVSSIRQEDDCSYQTNGTYIIAWRLTVSISVTTIEPIRPQSRTRFDRCWRGPTTSSEGRCRYAVTRRHGLAWDSRYATETTYQHGGRETPIALRPNSPR